MRNPRGVWFWPVGRDDLIEVQRELAAAAPGDWTPPAGDPLVGGCFVCFPRGHTGRGSAGDPAWAATALIRGRRRYGHYLTIGSAGAAYEPGLLALRMGEILEAVVRGLPESPDVLLVDATGRDHPRRAGLALHLGAVLDLPTVGVTHRPLVASGEPPEDHAGAASPLVLDGEVVGFWLRTRSGVRPLAVHAGWKVDAVTALDIVRHCWCRRRTPEPLREARRLARIARDQSRPHDERARR
ncbi:MAG TPA: endonuclease V [Actinomycetes bacterium]|nr:endonuclease V [Actinomycetes bacterium]